MKTISQKAIQANLTFEQMKQLFDSSIVEVDGAYLSHGDGHVDVIFTDGSNVIFDNELPSVKFNDIVCSQKTFFSRLRSGDKAVSHDHGLVSVLSIGEREGKRFATCKSEVPNQTTFDAIEGELHCPKDWQISTAIDACEARISNGAELSEAFKWLREEVDKAHKGNFTYDFN